MAKRGKSPRAQIPLRIPEASRAKLEKSAKARGVSMNAEIVMRLERSFEVQDRLGGAYVAEILEVAGMAMRSSGRLAALFAGASLDNWLVHPFCYDQAVAAAVAVLEAHRPRAEIVQPSPRVAQEVGEPPAGAGLPEIMANLGELVATYELRKKEQDK